MNAVYDLTGLKVPDKSDVSVVGEYNPAMFGYGPLKKGVKVADLIR